MSKSLGLDGSTTPCANESLQGGDSRWVSRANHTDLPMTGQMGDTQFTTLKHKTSDVSGVNR